MCLNQACAILVSRALQCAVTKICTEKDPSSTQESHSCRRFAAAKGGRSLAASQHPSPSSPKGKHHMQMKDQLRKEKKGMYWIAAWLMLFQLITQLTVNAQNTSAQKPLYVGQKRENVQLWHVLSNLIFCSVCARLNTSSSCVHMNGEVRSATGRCTSRLSGQSVQLQLCYVTWKYIWLPLLLEQDGKY